jgi:hypothetical protein
MGKSPLLDFELTNSISEFGMEVLFDAASWDGFGFGDGLFCGSVGALISRIFAGDEAERDEGNA